MRRGVDLLLVPDRRAAIAAAIGKARPGDVVLLAGKGHERAIIYAASELPWDERAVAEECLAAAGYG
jgi:UDP-N-acetylmuramoyl-L-alanyl-D-glutamate--2,6-diaminopimelate ligase